MTDVHQPLRDPGIPDGEATSYRALIGEHRMLRFKFPTGPFPRNPRAVVEATG